MSTCPSTAAPNPLPSREAHAVLFHARFRRRGSVTPTLGPHSRDAHGHAELFARLFLSFVLSVIRRITTLSRESRLDAPVIFVRNAVYGHPNMQQRPCAFAPI